MRFRLKNAITYMPLAYYYIGPIAFISYLMAARSLFNRFSMVGVSFCLCFTLYLLGIFYINGFVNGLYVIRYFWGFLFFFLIFKSGIQIQVEKILIFLSVLTILEAVLVNTILSANSLPNYDLTKEALGLFTDDGEYQRAYSFGGSASVTSVILVTLLSIAKLGWRGKLLTVSAIMTCMSGSGMAALFIYYFLKARTVARLWLASIALGIVYSGLVYRVSEGYINFLLDYKSNQFMNQLPTGSISSLLFGLPFSASMGGDFAGLSFLTLNGVAGLIFFLTIIFLRINQGNWLPIMIMLMGTLHYGAIFYLPGQLIFGYLLNTQPEEKTIYART